MKVLRLFLLLALPVLLLANRFNVKKKEKPKPVPIVKYNVDLLPSLQVVLDDMQLTDYLKNFVRMGVSESRLLLKLSAMDFQIMMMDWPEFDNEKVSKLKSKIQELISIATIKEEPIRPDILIRNKLTYGRIFLENGVASSDYLLASFGGVPPIGKTPYQLASDIYECDNSTAGIETINYHQHFIVAKRGNCTFLQKALNAKAHNASGLIIANSEDVIESPASGHGIDKNITEALVLTLGNFVVLGISNSSYETLNKTLYFETFHTKKDYHMMNIVPLKCQTGGKCLPVLPEERELQAEVLWGRMRVTVKKQDNSNKRSQTFEFLTSNYGGSLPIEREYPIVIAEPMDACSNLTNTNLPQQPFVVAAIRGSCRFDEKSLYAQGLGARTLILINANDETLQRVGGMQPIVGNVGIPTILTTKEVSDLILPSNDAVVDSEGNPMSSSLVASVEFIPARDTVGFDNWLEIAHTEWEADDDSKLIQLQGLIKKYQYDSENHDIVRWLQRRVDEIELRNNKSIDTDGY